MSIASVVLRGYTAEGSMPLVVTRGYELGAAVAAVDVTAWGRRPRKSRREQDEEDFTALMEFMGPYLGARH